VNPRQIRARKEAATSLSMVEALYFYDRWTGTFIRRSSGVVAGSTNTAGHIQINVGRQLFVAHRLAWLFVHGEWPTNDLDHINGNKSDNRMTNLRLAAPFQNCRNRKMQCTSKTGFKGVGKIGSRFRARIKVNGREIHLGLFKTAEEAHATYVEAATKIFGEFARAA
jgi:hypothetical protein